MKKRIKKDEEVVVIAGASKGRTGKVLKVLPSANRVLVEGVNQRWHHIKPSQQDPKGGRVQKECPIHISNVMLKSRHDERKAAKAN